MWSFTEWLIYLQCDLLGGKGIPFKWNAALGRRSFGSFTEAAHLTEWWDTFLKMERMVQLRDDLWKDETRALNIVLCSPIHVIHWSRNLSTKGVLLLAGIPSDLVKKFVSSPHKSWLYECRVCSRWRKVLQGTSEIPYPTESLLSPCGPHACT